MTNKDDHFKVQRSHLPPYKRDKSRPLRDAMKHIKLLRAAKVELDKAGGV